MRKLAALLLLATFGAGLLAGCDPQPPADNSQVQTPPPPAPPGGGKPK